MCVWGGEHNTCGNSGRVEGGLFLCSKNGNSGEEGGLCQIPSVVVLWIFSGITHYQYCMVKENLIALL